MPMFSPAAAVAAGYSFNMTAGDFGGSIQGYSDGNLLPAFGSIDAEPVSGETLVALIDQGSGSGGIVFTGDLLAEFTGLSVYVDSVEYPFDTDWSNEGGVTQAGWSSSGPDFVNTTVYFIEIK